MASLQNLKTELVNGCVNHLYIFTGEEIAVRKIYIDKLVETAKLETFYSSSMSEVINVVQNKQMLGEKNKLYIVIDDTEWLKQEKAWPLISTGKIQLPSTVVLIYNKLDKRSKFYKAHEDYIYNFEKLTPAILKRTIMSKYSNIPYSLEDSIATELIAGCDCDYSRILLELDKCKSYADSMKMDLSSATRELLDKGLIYKSANASIFALTDNIINRDIISAYELLHTLENPAQSAILVVSILYNAFLNMILVACNENHGLKGFMYHKAKQACVNYSLDELYDNIAFIGKLDYQLKTGKMPSEIAIDYIIAEVS